MMLADCYGLVRVWANLEPAWAEAIDLTLRGQGGRSLW